MCVSYRNGMAWRGTAWRRVTGEWSQRRRAFREPDVWRSIQAKPATYQQLYSTIDVNVAD